MPFFSRRKDIIEAEDCRALESVLSPSVTDVRYTLSWDVRIANLAKVTGFPKALFVAEDGRVVGTWIMGNNYQVKPSTDGDKLYGGYPAGYLRRIKALFPEKKAVLHLFSGRVDLSIMPGDTVDISLAMALVHPPGTSMHYTDDAQSLERVPLATYDLVLADPPYSVEDAAHYSTTMVKRNKVMRALAGCRRGAHIVILDQVLWMYRKDQFALEAVIGMVKSTNHRFRVITIFRRK